MRKTKVIFFIEPDWVYGRIHYDLMKYLWEKNIDCHLLPWNRSYSLDEFKEIDKVTDLFLTTPHGWRFLGHEYGANPEKTVIVSHSKLDYTDLIEHFGYEDFSTFRKFSCVSPWLIDIAKQLNIERIPELLPVGINYNAFSSSISNELRVVGFAGAFKENTTHGAIKRGWLVKQAAENASLKFSVAQGYHNSFVTMPGFYPSVDCIICASTEEGAGFPVLEGGAAGRLIISTRVGHWDTKLTDKGADFVDIEEKAFVEQTTELLLKYKNDSQQYRQRCEQIQGHAKTYDWNFVIDQWSEFLS
jgi:glycosyltransferase involved in cell wall biosynthesis